MSINTDPSVVISPPTETEHKSIELTIAPTAQLAPEDHSQLKNPPELGMQVPVESGRNPSVVIPPFAETEHKSTEPTIAPTAQLAPEDHSQFKNPPELEMLVPVEMGLDSSSLIPPSTGTEHESTEPTIASKSQLATAIRVSSQ